MTGARRRRPRVSSSPPIDESHLRAALDGLRFPTKPWQMLAWAEYNGAGAGVRAALSELPERPYLSIAEIVREIRCSPRWAPRIRRRPMN